MRSTQRVRAGLAAAAVAAVALPGSARADDQSLRDVLQQFLPQAVAVEKAARASSGTPRAGEAAQAEYDVARDFVEALAGVLPVSKDCLPAERAAADYGNALVLQAEGVDRPDPSLTDDGVRAAAAAADRYNRVQGSCGLEPPALATALLRLTRPLPNQALFGTHLTVEARAPAAAVAADVELDRDPTCDGPAVAISGGHLETTLRASQGPHTLRVVYCARTGTVYHELARPPDQLLWLLPGRELAARGPRATDGRLSARLESAAASFRGYSAVWFHDLRTGRTAAWSADSAFPAASTVKLGLLIACLHRFGAVSPFSYDIEAMATWSSNLATNRLLRELGDGSTSQGGALAQDALRRVGAVSSTFTGGYRVGTGRLLRAGPPLTSSRVTTARDLGRILYEIHAAAAGDRAALALLRLSRARAQVALGLLLGTQPAGDNIGLFSPWLPRGDFAAQKQGWLSAARHTAAIVYTRTGPKIVVVLTYRDGLTLVDAQGYAGTVLATLGI